MDFRNRCRETDDLIKKTTQNESEEPVDVKQEGARLDGEKIKDEPTDEFVDLFENIDTVLEEPNNAEESNALAGIANAKEELTENSESDEEFRRRRRNLKNFMKNSVEFDIE